MWRLEPQSTSKANQERWTLPRTRLKEKPKTGLNGIESSKPYFPMEKKTSANKKNEKDRESEKTCLQVDFAVLADHREKMKVKKIVKYLDLARELRTLWNMKLSDNNYSWWTWTSLQELRKETKEIRRRRKNQDHPDNKSKRLAVTQISVENPPIRARVKNSQRW